MSFCGRVLVLALLAFAALLGSAQAASAKVFQVQPGESIQEAIDQAQPGDTVRVARGTFHENLTITKNRITLRGAGPGKHGTRLLPADEPTINVCAFEVAPGVFQVDGICVAGEFDPMTFEPGEPVVGTRISGFHVKGHSGFGVFLFVANNSTVKHVQASHNESYGISGFVLSGIRLLRNNAHHNHEPGFYVGDSPNARAVIVGNRAHHNEMGIFLRDASKGVVRNNRVHDNCLGMLILETGAPDPAERWRVKRNLSRHNTEACPDTPGGDLSGGGIVIAGADRVTLWRNKVLGNRPSIPSPLAGGIVVVASTEAGGDDPNHNRIVRNVAFRNQPFDVFWDGSGDGNRFRNNHCGTSDPAWICDDNDDD
jgi:parallel beta-helix repeat protein